MNRSKKIFLIIAVTFFVVIAVISYDIARKTTFPGSKSQLKERIQKEYLDNASKNSSDTVRIDLKE